METEEKMKHLEFIEATITRMSDKSSSCKNIAFVLVGTLLGFFVESSHGKIADGNEFFIYLAILILLVFCFLDAFYLRLERKYRKLYSLVAEESGDVERWSMDTRFIKGEKTSFMSSLFSKSAGLFYGVIIAILIVFAVVGKK